jgi:hypothetical protein
VLRALDKNPAGSQGGGVAEAPLAQRSIGPGAGGDALVCARCGHTITDAAARVDIDGRHAHTGVNQGGHVHHFGCFSRAPGAAPLGPRELLWSWFPGRTWQLVSCRGCEVHLGWCFAGEGAPFWGLLSAAVVPAADWRA